jgi:hypothetical protein
MQRTSLLDLDKHDGTQTLPHTRSDGVLTRRRLNVPSTFAGI